MKDPFPITDAPARMRLLRLADQAVRRAENLAGHAESAAHSDDHRHKAAALAAAGALWADIGRAHAAIAAAMPDTDSTSSETEN